MPLWQDWPAPPQKRKRKNYYQPWWRIPYVGYTVENFLRYALRVKHLPGIQYRQKANYHHSSGLISLLYYIVLSCSSSSYLFFLQYLRIFEPNKTGSMFTFVAIQICIWSCFIMYLVATILAIARCTPREEIRNPLMTRGHCINTSAAYFCTAICNVIADFAILILPMPSLWKLQMPLKKENLDHSNICDGSLVNIYQYNIIIVLFPPFLLWGKAHRSLLIHSACVTSILQTYYPCQIVQSRDTS